MWSVSNIGLVLGDFGYINKYLTFVILGFLDSWKYF
jgi:hypothetical protein